MMHLLGRQVGLDQPLFLIAGPCVIESEQHATDLAGQLADITRRLRVPFIFKASYDKANRTSARSFRGPGLDEGLRISGRSPDGKFVEIAEIPDHPWYVAVQFHPEFKSKPTHPHPLFAAFVEASYKHKTAGVGRSATESVV